jgi:signal transduction histidine kinase
VNNAIEYNRAGGEVRLRLQAVGANAVLSVSDTGCGIPEADHPHVFERFYRADKARSRARGGTGLGLAICKDIVTAHGGTIDFESKVNEGTTFRVRLPRSAD